jgi:hypothetical protein
MMMNSAPTLPLTRNDRFLASLCRILWPDADRSCQHVFVPSIGYTSPPLEFGDGWATDYGEIRYALDSFYLDELIASTEVDHDEMLRWLPQKAQLAGGVGISYQVLIVASDPALFDHPLTHRYYDTICTMHPWHSGYRAIKVGGELALLPPRYRMLPIDGGDPDELYKITCEGF